MSVENRSSRGRVAALGGSPYFETARNIVRPTFPALERFLPAFDRGLQTGTVTNNGPWLVEFEKQLTNYLGVPSLAFCNGQTAMMAMLRAAGIEGGEVIVPSFTFAATPHAVRWCGAEPVFADVAGDGSMCLDAEDVERKITSRTVAIMGVDVYGIACDYPALEELGRRKGLKVLFDSAPSFGTRVNGQLVGGFGDGQMFSFHATKAFATMEGGCLCSHDESLLDRAKAIRNFGQVAGGDTVEPGLNGKMMELCALIGLEQLNTFEVALATRRRSVERIRGGLAKLPGLHLARESASQQPVWLYLPVVIDPSVFGLDRNQVARALEKENLFARKYYSPPCHHMAAYSSSKDVSLPVTEYLAYNVLALPIYNDMTDEECDGIVQIFTDIRRAADDLKSLWA